MPNHVTSRIVATGPVSDLCAFREMFDGEGLDFNRIIPMPELLRDTESSSVSEVGAILLLAKDQNPFGPSVLDGLYERDRKGVMECSTGRPKERVAAFLAQNPDYETKGRQKLRAIAETGYPSWYEWSIDHWGTKWGAYSPMMTDAAPESGAVGFGFDTAWDFPTPIFEELARRFPTLSFDCVCFDEGWNFAGEGKFSAAETTFATSKELATDEMYERVYGQPPEHYEDEEA